MNLQTIIERLRFLILIVVSVLVCSQSAYAKCDIKLINGEFHLFDATDSDNTVTTLTITDNLISYVGNGGGETCTQTINLGGKVVIPGLNDAHVHFFNRVNAGGHLVSEIDTARSTQEMIDILNAAIVTQNVPPVSGPVTVRNFLTNEGGNSPRDVSGGWPSISELDKVDRPVLLVQRGFSRMPSGIRGLVNTAAKEYFESKNIGTISADGSVANTVPLAAHLLALESPADRQQDWLDGNRWTASVGITAMQNFLGSPLDYPELLELYDNNIAFLRFHSSVRNTAEFQAAVKAGNHEGNNPDMLRLTSIGEFGAGANFRRGPTASYGSGATDMANAGITTMQHALRSHEVDGYLNSWAAVDATVDINKLRWRLDHTTSITNAQMDRLVALGGNVSVHGIRRPSDLRSIYDHGVNVSTGSDGGNFTTINPWVVINSWVTGQNALKLFEAIHMYTIGSAYDTFDEDKYGSLEVGKFADLAVLGSDPFNTNDLINVKSALTIVDGDIVYSDGSVISCEGNTASGLWFRNQERTICEIGNQ